MQLGISLLVAGAVLMVGCDGQAREEQGQPEVDSVAAGPDTGSAPDVFVDQATPGAQLLFVGVDSMKPAAGRAGAVFVPVSTFSVERNGIPNELPPADSMAALLAAAGVHGERHVIVGAPIPAARAYAAFDYLGLGDRTSLLNGGVAALDPATPAAAPAARDGNADDLRIDVRDDMIVDAGWVHERLDDAGVVILDARPPAEFSGDTPGDGVSRPGHIPGAKNMFWQTLIVSEQNPRLKEEAELRRLFGAAGATPGKTIVAYCRTGGQASFLYAVARHLGYDVRLYDGSFVDWSRTDYPVER